MLLITSNLCSKERKERGDLKNNDYEKMRNKQFENWGKWDEFDDAEEEKNYKKQQNIWKNMYHKNDGAHPEGKQFKDFEEALWSSSGTKIAKVVCMCSFFFLIFSSLSIAILEVKEEERNDLKNKSDFERLFAQENLRSKSELKNMDRYFGSSSNDKDPK